MFSQRSIFFVDVTLALANISATSDYQQYKQNKRIEESRCKRCEHRRIVRIAK